MSKKFKIIKDYYDCGFDLFKKDAIVIDDGIVVLVGCNGSGKTTLLNAIKEQLEEENVPYMTYDNKNDGGLFAKNKLLFYGECRALAERAFSSEGEEIILNIGDFVSQIKSFYKTGKSTHSFNKPNPECKERFILFDAVDSGMSIDNMKDVKDVFDLIVKDAKSNGINLYIIISTNSYEFAKDSRCLDVYEGEYITFKSYDDYADFIVKSRDKKNKRS